MKSVGQTLYAFLLLERGEMEGISPSPTPKMRRYAKVKTLTYLLNHMVKTVALTNSLSAGYSLVLLEILVEDYFVALIAYGYEVSACRISFGRDIDFVRSEGVVSL